VKFVSVALRSKNKVKRVKKYEETRYQEHCKPRVGKLVLATQNKVLTEGDVELPENINDRRKWMARERQKHSPQECNSSWIKKKLVYQKCLEENQDTLKADRVIEIATDDHNSDCQRSVMQTLSTASAAATAIHQGSTQVHKVHEKH